MESFENLSSINEDLTQIEKEPSNKELLNKLYRTVHTMKGSASFLGYKKLQDITHSAENLLDELRESKFEINPDIGTISIKAYNESGQVTIEIIDDGRGLDREKIGKKAIEKGVITQNKFDKMTDLQVYNLVFAPGFSTAEKITNTSGRGVGMDVVKTNIEKIGGSVIVNSEFGIGSTFKMRIPLTLAIVPALIIKSNKEAFAIPQLNLLDLKLRKKKEKSKIFKVVNFSS